MESLQATFCECRYSDLSPYPIITLQIGAGHFYHLDPKHYLIPESVENINEMQQCLFTFREELTELDTWELGTPFLRSYLQIYDLEEQRIGLFGGQVQPSTLQFVHHVSSELSSDLSISTSE